VNSDVSPRLRDCKLLFGATSSQCGSECDHRFIKSHFMKKLFCKMKNPSLQPNQSSHQRSPQIMSSALDLTPLSFSQEQLTPHSDNTVFSLSHSPTLWTARAPPGNCEYYWHAILLMTSGGSVLICGMVLSGLYFAGISVMATNILGPALLSVGLMVLVVGVVLVPITREMRYQSATKRLCNHYP
ncbi:putative phosphoinositide-interacting protein-like, partial [Triplophysa rosa]